MKNVLVIGAGKVGSIIVKDLINKHNVTVLETKPYCNFKYCNELQNHQNLTWVSNFDDVSDKKYDSVVNAVPGSIGFSMLSRILTSIDCKSVIDISFMPEDFTTLDDLAKSNDKMVIPDMGVAPGIPNLIAGYVNKTQKIDTFKYSVGGLPTNPKPPLYYEAPFSTLDALDEYLRPARYKEYGKILCKNPVDFFDKNNSSAIVIGNELKKLGKVPTDGLRSMLSMDIPSMYEYTYRHIKNLEVLNTLKTLDFFEPDNIHMLQDIFNKHAEPTGDKEFTYLKVDMLLESNVGVSYILIDHGKGNESSMSRTTGYAATGMLDFVHTNKIHIPGVIPPENLCDVTTANALKHVNNYLTHKEITIDTSNSCLFF